MSTLEQVLEAALELPREEQEALVTAVQKHQSIIRQAEFAEYARQARLDVQMGQLKPQTVDEIMSQLDDSEEFTN
jgi:isocitrate/isopropylmalate dehydrogenase